MMADKQAVRAEFRRVVFERDGHRCVIPGCAVRGNEDVLDAHHLISRKFMPEGGYTLGNGVTLCKAMHHQEAEDRKTSVLELRRLIGQYAGGQKHTHRKFPKTPKHPDFPTPEPENEDDPESPEYDNTVTWAFMEKHFSAGFVATEKLDGSNIGLGVNVDAEGNASPHVQTRGQIADPHNMHFLSLQHERNVKAALQWAWENFERFQVLAPGWMVFGEWLRFRHTVPYYSLPEFFVAWGVSDGTVTVFNKEGKPREEARMLPPVEARTLLQGLGFQVPPLLELGDLKERTIERATRQGAYTPGPAEGVVIRSLSDGTTVKWVRGEFREAMKRHGHWTKGPLEDNALATQPWVRPKQQEAREAKAWARAPSR